MHILDVLDTLAKDHTLVRFHDTTFGMRAVGSASPLHRSTFAAVVILFQF